MKLARRALLHLTAGAAAVAHPYFLVRLVLNNGTGEPGRSTLFYNLYLYKTFFLFQDMAYGAAYAYLGDHHLAQDAAQDAFLEALEGGNRKSPAATSRALHLLAPNFFPLWDNWIAQAYGCMWNAPPEAASAAQ